MVYLNVISSKETKPPGDPFVSDERKGKGVGKADLKEKALKNGRLKRTLHKHDASQVELL